MKKLLEIEKTLKQEIRDPDITIENRKEYKLKLEKLSLLLERLRIEHDGYSGVISSTHNEKIFKKQIKKFDKQESI